MFRRGWWVIAMAGLMLSTQVGCKSLGRRNRIERQPVIEEYNLPPSDSNITAGPFYPEQKRQLPTQMKEQERALGMAGRSGGGVGAGGNGPGR
jgi:hypothetical protein